MNKSNLASWRKWLYAVVAAFIGGAATAAVSMWVAPDTFNFGNMRKLGELAVGAGIINVLMYLKQSPLPQLKIENGEEQDGPDDKV